ncbi:MAG: ribonuclease III [Clostridia bacterium]|nr:ribonuclease III [Clostridia bacterium]
MAASMLSPAALAYLGDAVCELYVRELLVELGFTSSARLNRFALDFVRATAQAEAVSRIMPMLSEEEAALFRRGRNHSLPNVPKSATMREYRQATGFEVLLGGLYHDGQTARLRTLMAAAYAPEIAAVRAELGLAPAPDDQTERKDDPS